MLPGDAYRTPIKLLAAYVILVTPLVASVGGAQSAPQKWFRGNTHTHTTNSDGDSPPDSVAKWYRDHGYAFLFITDHERITDPAPLNALYGAPGKFLLIPAEEVTQVVADSSHPAGRRQAHVNALGIRSTVTRLGPGGLATGITMREGYARNIAAIRDAGGIAQVNHPNLRWSVRLDDLAALPDSTLLEIANAHTGVNNDGGDDGAGGIAPSTEALWDSLLTRGKLLFGIGDDDSHSFRPDRADSYDLTRPGRSWIMVRADTLTESAILGAIRRGSFYASTGVTIRELSLDTPVMSVVIERVGSDDRRLTIDFIGSGGRTLYTAHGTSATYRVRGDEAYVRIRVTDSNGLRAWTQPRMVK